MFCLLAVIGAGACNTGGNFSVGSTADAPNEIKSQLDFNLSSALGLILVNSPEFAETPAKLDLFAVLSTGELKKVVIGKDSANNNGELYDFWVRGGVVFISVSNYWKPDKKIWCSLVTLKISDGGLSCYLDKVVKNPESTILKSPVIQRQSPYNNQYYIQSNDSTSDKTTVTKIVRLDLDDSSLVEGSDAVNFQEGSVIIGWAPNTDSDILVLSDNGVTNLSIYNSNSTVVKTFGLGGSYAYFFQGPWSTYGRDFYFLEQFSGYNSLFLVEKSTLQFNDPTQLFESQLVNSTKDGLLGMAGFSDKIYVLGVDNTGFYRFQTDPTTDHVQKKQTAYLDSVSSIISHGNATSGRIIALGRKSGGDSIVSYDVSGDATSDPPVWNQLMPPGIFTIDKTTSLLSPEYKVAGLAEYKLDVNSAGEILFYGKDVTDDSSVIGFIDSTGDQKVLVNIDNKIDITSVLKIKALN